MLSTEMILHVRYAKYLQIERYPSFNKRQTYHSNFEKETQLKSFIDLIFTRKEMINHSE